MLNSGIRKTYLPNSRNLPLRRLLWTPASTTEHKDGSIRVAELADSLPAHAARTGRLRDVGGHGYRSNGIVPDTARRVLRALGE